MSEYFSVAALFIMFREALEAAIIIAVLLQLLEKLNMSKLKKWVWFGAITGVAISVALGIVFVLLFHLANTKLFSGNASLIFKGVIAWIASLMITYVAFHMLKFYNLERKWKVKLQAGLDNDLHDEKKAARSYKWSMFILAGAAALREGIESILFLTGVSAGSGVKSIIIPGAIGIALGAICGVCIFWGGKSIRSLKWFFIVSCALLLLIAAGMVVTGTANFQSAGLFGVMYPYEWRPWSNLVLWDTSSCCDPDSNDFWALTRALFGYQDQPLNLQLLFYCLYWFVTICLLVYKWRTGSLTDYKEATLADQESFRKHEAEAAAAANGGGKFSRTFSKMRQSFNSMTTSKKISAATVDVEEGNSSPGSSSPKGSSAKLERDSEQSLSVANSIGDDENAVVVGAAAGGDGVPVVDAQK